MPALARSLLLDPLCRTRGARVWWCRWWRWRPTVQRGSAVAVGGHWNKDECRAEMHQAQAAGGGSGSGSGGGKVCVERLKTNNSLRREEERRGGAAEEGRSRCRPLGFVVVVCCLLSASSPPAHRRTHRAAPLALPHYSATRRVLVVCVRASTSVSVRARSSERVCD